jgi:hypothetical protein
MPTLKVQAENIKNPYLTTTMPTDKPGSLSPEMAGGPGERQVMRNRLPIDFIFDANITTTSG